MMISDGGDNSGDYIWAQADDQKSGTITLNSNDRYT